MIPSKENSQLIAHNSRPKNLNPRAIILLGAPGAGKGTQAELLSEKPDLYYLETSKVLEERFRSAREGEYVEAEGSKYVLADEKKRWETGLLCSFPFVTAIVQEKINQVYETKKSLLMAGSPRSLYEAEKEVPLIEKLYGKENIHIIVLEITGEQTIFRNSHRRICELMRHPILFHKETEFLTICPLDGSKLVRRTGLDDLESIKVRLQEYKEHTLPVIAYFEDHGLQVKKIDGSRSPAEVFSDVLKIVEQ